jgi:hypothetical protein
MARAKTDHDSETETTMATASSESTREQPRTPKQKFVVIDYRGVVGRATVDKGAISNSRATPHRLSPLMAFWPENGKPDLQLQPGVNLVPTEIWKLYTEEAKGADDKPGHPQVMEMVKAKYIRIMTKLPDDSGAVLDMITRSLDHDGLRWIAEQEKAGENSQEVLDAVTEQLAKAKPIKLKPTTFQRAVPLVKDGNAPQPSLAMG